MEENLFSQTKPGRRSAYRECSTDSTDYSTDSTGVGPSQLSNMSKQNLKKMPLFDLKPSFLTPKMKV